MCVNESLIVLSYLIVFKELYPLFAEYKNTIIVDICLPLIATTQEDLKQFQGDPQGFLSLTLSIRDENVIWKR